MNKRRRYLAKRRRAANQFWNGPKGRAYWQRFTRAAVDVLMNHQFLPPGSLTRTYDTDFSDARLPTTHGRKRIDP